MHLSPKWVSVIGWAGTALALSMYFSFIDQIMLNLDGKKGSWIIPLVTMASAATWTAFGFLSKPRIWPIVVCNAPGVPLALVAFLSAVY